MNEIWLSQQVVDINAQIKSDQFTDQKKTQHPEVMGEYGYGSFQQRIDLLTDIDRFNIWEL